MRIDWNRQVAGVPMLKVRDILKQVQSGINDEWVRELIGGRDPAAFIDELVAEGWVERDGRDYIRTTLEGRAVAQAKKLKPLSRAKADELLNKVLAAAEEINRDTNHAYDVSRLAVFGSYLGDTDELGDLDIAYELDARWDDNTWDEVRERCFDAFPPPASADFMRKLGWPEEVALKKLTVSNRVSLESLSAVEKLGFPHRLLLDVAAVA